MNFFTRLSQSINTYTCGVTIVLKVCGDVNDGFKYVFDMHKYEKKCFIFEFDLDLCFEILVLKKQEIL